MNLYDLLQIKSNATPAAIKNAYRGLSKKYHPDHGGSVESFMAIKKAYDILSDKERRKKYDSTGDVSEKTIDNGNAAVMEYISRVFEAVYAQMDKMGVEPSEHDFLQSIKDTFDNEKDNLEKLEEQVARNLKKTKKMVGKFKTKKQSNFLNQIVLMRIKNMEATQQNIKVQKETAIKCIKFLKDYSYEMENKRSMRSGVSGFGTSSTVYVRTMF